MKDLFYSEAERILFWVSGYDILNSNSNVVAATTDMLNDAKKLADVIKRDVSKVRTETVLKSNVYQYMRVFYIEDVRKCPANAHLLPKDKFTMNNWLSREY